MDGTKVKDTSKNAHVKPVTVDLMATIDCFGGNFYFKYSPCDLIKNGYDLQFKKRPALLSTIDNALRLLVAPEWAKTIL